MNQWVISITAVLAAIGGKELIMFIVKSYQKNKEQKHSEEHNDTLQAQLREDYLIAENTSMLNQLLKEVKEELKVNRQIETELREKYSDCKARLEILFKELSK